MRAFIAVDLPESQAAALARLQDHIPEGRVVARENLHLTLLFLDDRPVPVLEELDRELHRLAPVGFDLRLTGLGSFGGKAPRSLHAEVAADPALSGLHQRVRHAARRAGIDLPHTRFRPHVTLARFGSGLSRDGQTRIGAFVARHGMLGIPPARVTSFGLYRSILQPDGPIYEALARYPLPVLRKSALGAAQGDAPPLGGFTTRPVTEFAHVFQSPGPIYEPGGTGA
jgi:2'-5' RNA ligase